MNNVTIKTQNIKIADIKLNSENPRTINKHNMDLLIKSLKEFPEMIQIREIMLDENMICLCGNMRILALKAINQETCNVRIIHGLTPDQKREFIIKDNTTFGEWDFDKLEAEWVKEPLEQWGGKILGSYDLSIPDDNENIDEESFTNTEHECQECGFKW